MKRLIKGFTLIELMIVVAIISIITTLAIPAYQEYQIRSRVTEGVQLAAPAKLAVSEFTLTYNQLPTNQAETGYLSPSPTNNVASVVVMNNGVIIVSYNAQAGNGTIQFVPTLQASGELTWTCTGGSLAPRYRPASCRL